jgi:hypothetical protein
MKNTSYATTVGIDLDNKSHRVCAIDAEDKRLDQLHLFD